MRFKTVLIFAAVLVSVFLWQTSNALAFEEIYARVSVSSIEEKGNLLAERGLDVADAGPGWVDVVVNSQQLSELISKGYNVKVQYWTPKERNIAILGPNWDLDFPSYNQLVADMEQVAINHPDIVILDTLGYSVQGRMILAAKVSDNPSQEENEPEFRIIGNHHGNELMGIQIGLNMLHYLTDNYGSNTQVTHLVNDLETWIIPMMNPDGRTAGTRYNADGVDLNRDYGYMWNAEGGDAYGFAEPETRAIRLHAMEHNIAISLSFHTAAMYVNYVWNYRPFPIPDSAFIVNISQEYGSYTPYTVIEGYNWYQTYGDCNDWSYGSRGDLDATIETADGWSNVTTTWNYNRPAILAMMERTDDGVRGILTDMGNGQPLEGMVRCTQFGLPVFSEKTIGDYQKNLLPGTYTMKFSANGYQDSTISGVTVSSGSPTILNVALKPSNVLSAVHVVSCFFAGPSNYSNNTTNASAALGLPDGLFASLGKGGNIVLDMGERTKIYDLDGYDFTVTEIGNDEGYNVYWCDLPYGGTWHLIGSGFGTTSFDIASQSTDSIRYIKIVDDNNGDPNEQNPGCDIDAVTHPKPVTGALVTLHSYQIDDDSLGQSRGNNNGQVDYGETIELSLVLENLGDSTAFNVGAALSTTNPLISVIDSLKTFGDMPAGDTMASAGKYVFSVSTQIPDGTIIPFHLNITSLTKNWGYDGPNITAHAPNLIYLSNAIDDIGGNGNGKPDPGETCSVVVTVKNTGSSDARQVQGALLSSDPYITITSGTSSYPDLPAGNSGAALTPYQIDISGSCPVGHTASFILQIQAASSYSTEDTFQINLGQKPILFVDDDGGGPYQSYFLSALDSTGLSYDVWTYAVQGTPTDSLLALYQAVVWNTGPDYGTISAPKTLTAADQARLITYLDNGGNLFLSSQDLLLDNNPDNFITNYLHVADHTDDVGETSVAGVDGDTISGGMAFNLNPPFSNYSDYIVPGAGAAGIFYATSKRSPLPRVRFQTDDDAKSESPVDVTNYCALRYPDSGSSAYKVVFLAFPFEGIPASGTSPSNSYTLMRKIMDWFGLSRTTPPFIRGDANGDSRVDAGDIVYLINYLFKNGPAPYPLAAGDVDCNGTIDAGDIVYLLNYLFRSGPAPSC